VEEGGKEAKPGEKPLTPHKVSCPKSKSHKTPIKMGTEFIHIFFIFKTNLIMMMCAVG